MPIFKALSDRFPPECANALYEVRQRGETCVVEIHVKDRRVFGCKRVVASHEYIQPRVPFEPLAASGPIFEGQPDLAAEFSAFVDSGQAGTFLLHFEQGRPIRGEVRPGKKRPRRAAGG